MFFFIQGVDSGKRYKEKETRVSELQQEGKTQKAALPQMQLSIEREGEERSQEVLEARQDFKEGVR